MEADDETFYFGRKYYICDVRSGAMGLSLSRSSLADDQYT